MNLLPILPLDGGHIAETLLVSRKGAQGGVLAHQVSFVLATVLAAVMVATHSLYLAFFYGSLAYTSFQFFQHSGPRWRRYN